MRRGSTDFRRGLILGLVISVAVVTFVSWVHGRNTIPSPEGRVVTLVNKRPIEWPRGVLGATWFPGNQCTLGPGTSRKVREASDSASLKVVLSHGPGNWGDCPDGAEYIMGLGEYEEGLALQNDNTEEAAREAIWYTRAWP